MAPITEHWTPVNKWQFTKHSLGFFRFLECKLPHPLWLKGLHELLMIFTLRCFESNFICIFYSSNLISGTSWINIIKEFMKILFIASDPQNTFVIQSNTKHNTDMDVYFYKLVNGFIFWYFQNTHLTCMKNKEKCEHYIKHHKTIIYQLPHLFWQHHYISFDHFLHSNYPATDKWIVPKNKDYTYHLIHFIFIFNTFLKKYRKSNYFLMITQNLASLREMCTLNNSKYWNGDPVVVCNTNWSYGERVSGRLVLDP